MFVRLLLILVVVGVVLFVIREISRSRGPRFKCERCRHCRKLFADGVRCGFGSKEVFKNSVHIENCQDFSSR